MGRWIDADVYEKFIKAKYADGEKAEDIKEFTGMQKGLSGKKDYIFTFLDNPDVPYDNNALNGQLDRQRRSRKSQDFSVRSLEPKRMQ